MFIYCIQHAFRWHRTTRFIPHCVSSSKLIGVRESPPQIISILTDKGHNQITAVMVGSHLHLIPTDGHVIAIADGLYVFRRVIVAVSNGLKIRLVVPDGGDVSNHIHNRWSDPAKIFQLIEFDVKPVAIFESSTHRASVTGVQIGGMQKCNGGPITAMRLLIDSNPGKGKGGRGSDGWSERDGGR